MRVLRIVFIVTLLLLSVVPTMAQTDAFEPTDCPVEFPVTVQVRCGFVTVPKFHADPTGEQIKVAVAVVSSTSNAPQAPIVLAQGGPGGSGLAYFPRLFFNYNLFYGDRDVIILEQRGTKYSQPDLLCEENFAFTREYLNVNLSREESQALSDQVALACATRLFVDEGINPLAFNSLENAADIPFVVNALGYDEFHFYGVSYGTMLGQHLLNLNPAGLQSVILDANVPLSQNFLTLTGVNAERVFRLLFETCAKDAICNEAYPNLEAIYFETVDRLNENPVTVTLKDPEDGTAYPALINGDSMISLTFSAMYADVLVPLMPRYITQMAQGNFRWIELWGGELVLRKDFATAFYNTVMCAEDSDFTVADFSTDIYPQFFPVFSESTFRFPTLCANLGINALPSDIIDVNPVVDVPVFIASGEFDPITPPAGGDVIAASLPNSYHFVYPNAAHGALTSSECSLSMMTAFLNNPNERPDDSCMAELGVKFSAYVDDANGYFAVPVLEGWEDISTNTYTAFKDPATGSIIYIASVQSDDSTAGLLTAINLFDAGFSGAPLQSQEIDLLGEQWLNNVYLAGTTLRLGLTKVAVTNGIQIVVIVDFPSQAVVPLVLPSINSLVIGLEEYIP